MKTITLKSGKEIELNQAFNCDCLTFMKELPDKCIDLVLTDPPYGLPKRSAKGTGKLKNRAIQGMHEKGWDIKPTKELFNEIFRISKNQIIWGYNYFELPPCRGFLVWQKKQPWPNFADCELAYNSIDGVAKSYTFDNRSGDKIHPTQKPLKLFKWCLNNFAKKNKQFLTHF
jgi:site-specific DNA-methyltransferase (adenine-specific)